ncbi:hypothetical protein SBA3_4090002 [Candidatus Sulfopaludibacter sp. SbA3]|nr:hypothetical protein SBA3_4090002 [Candidatus Sulfopaludibacter sp. SbA3]
MYCRETGDAATEHIGSLSKLKKYYAGKTRITDGSLNLCSCSADWDENPYAVQIVPVEE